MTINSNKRTLPLILIALSVIVFPHFFHLPWPIIGSFYGFVLWRTGAIVRPLLLPGRKLLIILTLLALLMLWSINHSVFGRDAGTSALITAIGLKLMELRTPRDAYVVTFLAFFIALSQFLFSQTIWMAIYVLAICWLLVVALISLNSASSRFYRHYKTGASLILQALPIMVFLFVLFPRIPAPNFGFRDNAGQAVSGLSEVLEPGQISRLSLSQETAFRVTFVDKIPPREQRYWRGPVFWYSDGKRWTLPDQQPIKHSETRFLGSGYQYSIVLEPHHQKWLFALDLPTTLPANAYQTNEHVLLSRSKIRERLAYQLISVPVYTTGALNNEDRGRGLQLAIRPSQRVTELLRNWQLSSSKPVDIVESALKYFHREPFVYTLNPPLLEDNPTEQFLFETRKGFCEHFATAFVYLMRASKIPARVVTGYQGGEYNEIGNFIEVRQADAHAWAEIWLEEKGWVRVDPTAAVAPERIELGIDLGRQISTGSIAFSVVDRSGLVHWLRQAGKLWASLDHGWTRWVLGYDAYRQSRLFQNLGIESMLDKAMMLLSGFTLLMAFIWAISFRKKTNKQDKASSAYAKFCRKLASKGLVKKSTEGALDFAFRAMARLPEKSPAIDEITAIYLRLRYGKAHNSDDILNLRRLVRNF